MKSALPPVHPGAILREDVLPALNKSVSEIAELLGVSRQTLHAILSERAPVSTLMALRLGKLCGNGPEMWLNLQNSFDLANLASAAKDELDRIPTLTDAA